MKKISLTEYAQTYLRIDGKKPEWSESDLKFLELIEYMQHKGIHMPTFSQFRAGKLYRTFLFLTQTYREMEAEKKKP